MENVTAVLQKNLTLLRRRAGLTQEQFADKLGLSFQAVSKWENGLSCPDIALLPEIAAIYGVEIGQLFTPIDPENPPASREEDPAPDSAPDLGSAIDSLIRSVTHQVSQSIPSPKKMEFDFHWDNTPPPSFETALPVRVEGLPWEDDGVYRAVLFRGRSLVTPPAAEKGVLATMSRAMSAASWAISPATAWRETSCTADRSHATQSRAASPSAPMSNAMK